MKNVVRRRINLLEELVNVTARMPWWVGVALALAAWASLHWISTAALPLPSRPGPVLQNVAQPFARGLAMLLEYVLPAVFVFGAGMSAWIRYKHHKNYRDVSSDYGKAALERLSWREFENLVAEFFRRKGFTV